MCFMLHKSSLSPLHFTCSIEASTVTTLPSTHVQELLILLSVIHVTCLYLCIKVFNMLFLMFCLYLRIIESLQKLRMRSNFEIICKPDRHLDDEPIEISKFSRDIPSDFLLDKREELTNFIETLENSTRNQSDADENYNLFVNLIKKEMYQKVDFKTIKIKTGTNNKKRRLKKPWWSVELTNIWNELCTKEKAMLKSDVQSKRAKRDEFLRYRKFFNKEVQKAKRKFWKQKQTEIEQLETSDQKSFWKEIGKIGIGQERRKDIPCEVKLSNGEVSNKLEDVLDVWKAGFGCLESSGSFCFMSWCLKFLCCWRLMYVFIFLVKLR